MEEQSVNNSSPRSVSQGEHLLTSKSQKEAFKKWEQRFVVLKANCSMITRHRIFKWQVTTLIILVCALTVELELKFSIPPQINSLTPSSSTIPGTPITPMQEGGADQLEKQLNTPNSAFSLPKALMQHTEQFGSELLPHIDGLLRLIKGDQPIELQNGDLLKSAQRAEVAVLLEQSQYQALPDIWMVLQQQKRAFVSEVESFYQRAKSQQRRILAATSLSIIQKMNGELSSKNFSLQLSMNDRDLQSMRSAVEKTDLPALTKTTIVKQLFDLAQMNQHLLEQCQQYYRKLDTLKLVGQKTVAWQLQTPLNMDGTSSFNQSDSKLPLSSLMRPSPRPTFWFSTLLWVSFVLSFLWGWYQYVQEQLGQRQQQRSQEQLILKMFDHLLMKNRMIDFTDLQMSDNFKGMLKYFHEYAAKKMSYGQIFQETIPFPTVMLDLELKVRWFNNQFIEQWNLSEADIHEERFTWEVLSGRTNLSSSSPITEAMQNRLSGIYQIQVKKFGQESLLPYQMYVIPYSLDREPHCLLFFYPLLTLEETMAMQTKSLIGPVTRTLKSLVQGHYDEQFAVQSRREYEVGGIEDLHDLFDDLYQLQGNRVDRLCHEISELEQSSSESALALKHLQLDTMKLQDDHRQMQESLRTIKAVLIKLFDLWTDSQHGLKQLAISWDELWQVAQECFSWGRQWHEDAQRFINGSQSVSLLRGHTKEGREQIAQMKTILTRFSKTWQSFQEKMQKQQILNPSQNPSQNTSPTSSLQSHSMGTMAGPLNLCDLQAKELIKVSEFLLQTDKLMQHVDLTVSKFSMQLDEIKKSNASEVLQQGTKLPTWGTSWKKQYEELILIDQKMQHLQEELVASLSSLYEHLKGQFKIFQSFEVSPLPESSLASLLTNRTNSSDVQEQERPPSAMLLKGNQPDTISSFDS